MIMYEGNKSSKRSNIKIRDEVITFGKLFDTVQDLSYILQIHIS